MRDSLLIENGNDELTTDNYPEELVRDELASLAPDANSQEHRAVSYTVIAVLQHVEVSDNSTTILEFERLRTFTLRLEHNETWHELHGVHPTMTGERLRLTCLLYEGTPPTAPTVDNAYREVHLWVTVWAG